MQISIIRKVFFSRKDNMFSILPTLGLLVILLPQPLPGTLAIFTRSLPHRSRVGKHRRPSLPAKRAPALKIHLFTNPEKSQFP